MPGNTGLGNTRASVSGVVTSVAFVGTRTPVTRAIVGVCIAGNLGWALACVLLLASGTVHPSAWGTAYVVMKAVTVVLLAELQCFGPRRAPANAFSAA